MILCPNSFRLMNPEPLYTSFRSMIIKTVGPE